MRDHQWCLLPGSSYSAESLEPSLAWQEEVSSHWKGDSIPEVRWIPDWSDPWRVAEALASLAAQSVTGFAVLAGVRKEDRLRRRAEFCQFTEDGPPLHLEELADALGLTGRIRWVEPAEANAPATTDAGLFLLGPTAVLHPMALFSMGKALAEAGPQGLIGFLETLTDGETGGPHAVRFPPGPSHYSVFGGLVVSGSLWASASFWNRYREERLSLGTPLSGGFDGWPFVVSAVEWRVPLRRVSLALSSVETPRKQMPRVLGVPGDSVRSALCALAAADGISLADWSWDDGRQSGVPVPEASSAEVAAVIPFRDQEELTAATFRSLANQSLAARVRLVAVDNGSSQEIAGRLKSLAESLFGKARVTWLSVDAPFNFALLNNRGVAACQEPHLLFLNNDVEFIGQNDLAHLQGFLEWPEVGMVGGSLYYPDGQLQASGIRFSSAGPEVVRNPDAGALVFREVDALTFACAFARRDAFEQVGGLDEEVCPNGFGDALLGYRMKEAGWRILVDPAVSIRHHESKSRGSRPEEIERNELAGEGIPFFLHGVEFLREGQPMIQRFGRSRATLGKRIYRAFKAFRKELRG